MEVITWIVNLLVVIFGIILITKAEALYKFSWYSRHNVDRTGKNYVILWMKFSGIFLIIVVIIWSILILTY